MPDIFLDARSEDFPWLNAGRQMISFSGSCRMYGFDALGHKGCRKGPICSVFVGDCSACASACLGYIDENFPTSGDLALAVSLGIFITGPSSLPAFLPAFRPSGVGSCGVRFSFRVWGLRVQLEVKGLGTPECLSIDFLREGPESHKESECSHPNSKTGLPNQAMRVLERVAMVLSLHMG